MGSFGDRCVHVNSCKYACPYLYIYTYLCLILYDHIHRARDQKIVLGSKIFPRDQKHDVYMILYVNNIICHVKYIYNSYLCIERERKKKKDIHTLKNI